MSNKFSQHKANGRHSLPAARSNLQDNLSVPTAMAATAAVESAAIVKISRFAAAKSVTKTLTANEALILKEFPTC